MSRKSFLAAITVTALALTILGAQAAQAQPVAWYPPPPPPPAAPVYWAPAPPVYWAPAPPPPPPARVGYYPPRPAWGVSVVAPWPVIWVPPVRVVVR
jgi:hypothetical protein